MAIYEYVCTSCDYEFEITKSMNDDSITLCPKCEGEVKKIYSPPLIQFKGTGWYVTDYANKKNHLRQKAKEKETTE